MGEYLGLKFCKFLFLVDFGWLNNEMGDRVFVSLERRPSSGCAITNVMQCFSNINCTFRHLGVWLRCRSGALDLSWGLIPRFLTSSDVALTLLVQGGLSSKGLAATAASEAQLWPRADGPFRVLVEWLLWAFSSFVLRKVPFG